MRLSQVSKILANLVTDRGIPLNVAALFDSSGNPIITQTAVPGDPDTPPGTPSAWDQQTFDGVTSALFNVNPAWSLIEVELDGDMGPEAGDWQARLRLNNLNSGYTGSASESWPGGTQAIPSGVASGAPLVRTGYGNPGHVVAAAEITGDSESSRHISANGQWDNPGNVGQWLNQEAEVDHPIMDPLQVLLVDFGGTHFTGMIRVRGTI